MTEEKLNENMENAETMADYEKELEASFKKVKEGDILTGTVIGVTDSQVIVDLKYYAEGIIRREDITDDPDYNMQEEIHVGDEISGTVIKTDDGEGNILLSRKSANDTLVWEKFERMLEERTVVPVKVAEAVNGGVTAYLEGVRGFIPASKLAASYVENLDEWVGKTVEVTVITVEKDRKKLVLSGREVAREKERAEKRKKIEKCEVGAVMEGTVDTLKDYGAFVTLENGLSGLVHISRISSQRIKHPGVVLKEGQTVKVKIIGIKDGKISLSMKALLQEKEEEEEVQVEIPETEEIGTSMGDLLKNFKFQ